MLFRKINNYTLNFHRYCGEHSRKAQIARIKSLSRRSLPQTPEMLLLNLSHYAKPIESSAEDTEDEGGKIRALDPFSERHMILNYLHYISLYFHIFIFCWDLFLLIHPQKDTYTFFLLSYYISISNFCLHFTKYF